MEQKLPIILKKAKGRKYLVFMPDPEMNSEDDSDWFVRVSWRKTNTHAETDYAIIIKKDLKNWLRGYMSDKQGYKVQEDFDHTLLEKTELLP